MDKGKRWLIALGSIALAAIVVVVAYYVMLGIFLFGPEMTLTRTIRDVDSLVVEYIRGHAGQFPPNWEAVSETGRLKWVDTAEGRRYFYGLSASKPFDLLEPNSPSWRELLLFDQLEINFGFSVNDVRLEDDRLVGIDSGEEVFLIDGAYRQSSNLWYREYSVSWYKLMIEVRGNEE